MYGIILRVWRELSNRACESSGRSAARPTYFGLLWALLGKKTKESLIPRLRVGLWCYAVCRDKIQAGLQVCSQVFLHFT
jgi:hypothetical protein